MATKNADVFLYYYDNNTKKITLSGVVDDYISLTFERSYSGVGEWTMVIDGYSKNIDAIKNSNIIRTNQYCFGIISDITDEMSQDTYQYTITGVELKGLTQKRIILGEVTTTKKGVKKYSNLTMTDYPENIIYQMLYQNLTSPTISSRAISSDIVFDDDETYAETVEYDSRFGNLAEEIQTLAETYGIGWCAKLENDTEDSVKIVWHIFHGKNRTYEQDQYSRFVISYENNTLKSSSLEQMLHMANTAYIAGQGEDENRSVDTIENGSGFDRTEIYVDARDVESDSDLQQRGTEQLAEYGTDVSLEVEPALLTRNLYHELYDLGDLGTVVRNGVATSVQLTSITEIHENNEYNLNFKFGYDNATLEAALKRLEGNSDALIHTDPTQYVIASTTPVAVGTWVDGSTIYSVTMAITAKSSTQELTLPFNFSAILSVTGYVVKGTEMTLANSYYGSSRYFFVRGEGTNQLVYAAGSNSYGDGYITIQYVPAE